MAGILKSIMGLVRFIVMCLFLFVNWPMFGALVNQEISWSDAVSSLFSNWSILALSIILILTFVISFLNLKIVSFGINFLVLLILAGLFTGYIPLSPLRDTIASHIDINSIQQTLKPCGLNAVIERNGEEIRTALKNDEGETVGYVLKDDGNQEMRDRIIDLTGQSMKC